MVSNVTAISGCSAGRPGRVNVAQREHVREPERAASQDGSPCARSCLWFQPVPVLFFRTDACSPVYSYHCVLALVKK
jgi:hypothetical protein